MDRDNPLWGRLIKKVVSGGRHGVERAALDAAIANDIPHGGYRTKDDDAPGEYQLVETAGADLQAVQRENVRSADVAVVITRGSHGDLCEVIERLAEDNEKSFLHVDLDTLGERTGVASSQVKQLMRRPIPGHPMQDASAVFVTGSSESDAPGIEDEVRRLLARSLRDPDTIDEAADKLLWEMPDEILAQLREMSEDRLGKAHFGLGMYVRNAYGLFRRTCPLTQGYDSDPDTVSEEILHAAWQRLR